MQDQTVITFTDYSRLMALLELVSLKSKLPEPASHLYNELLKSRTVRQENIPANVVTMNSHLSVKDLNEEKEYDLTITYPQNASHHQKYVSVFAPTGVAVLGRCVGDIVSFKTPEGYKYLEITNIIYQPEASGDYSA
ncbi:MAG: GreA/GreB family elongation factor [Chryseolinea sp.]